MSFADYLGRFHPALVHFPIGVFLAIILLECLALRPKFKNLQPATRVLFMLGFVAACVAALTGFFHSKAEDFDEGQVNIHLVLGIGVAVVSFIALLLNGGSTKFSRKAYYTSLAILGLLTIAAGHTGASITWGTEYLSPANLGASSDVEFSEISKDAPLYAGLVKPVLEKKCVGCHGPSRQKGKLRLDAPDFIKRGGKDGEVLNLALPEEGELWRRITVESANDDHMPPIEKPQLSKAEISLITFWLQNGADFNSTLGSLPKSDSIMSVLTMASAPEERSEELVSKPDENIVEALTHGGVTVSFLSKEDGRVALQFINASDDSLATLMDRMSSISAQVVDLKMPGKKQASGGWKKLSVLKNLKRLSLENSNFSDDDLSSIQSLSKLEYLNLVGTAVTTAGLSKLSLPLLKHLYLFKTSVTTADLPKLKQLFPQAEIILGNYQVPTLEADTTEQKEKYVVPEKQ